MLTFISRYKFSLLTAIIVLSLSLMSSSEMPSTKLWDFKGIDKLVHLAMYSALSFVLFFERNRAQPITNKQPFNRNNVLPIVLLITAGGIIELIQPALATRSRELMDFFANTIGVFMGFYLQLLFKQLLKR